MPEIFIDDDRRVLPPNTEANAGLGITGTSENVRLTLPPAWEASKENVMPIKRGRSTKGLSASLSRVTASSYDTENEAMSSVLQQERDFETQLAAHSGTATEKMELYIKFYKWTQDSFPTKTDKTLKILERCTFDLKEEEDLKNNHKFVKLWIEYGDKVRTPGEIFSFMQTNKIGERVALFWIAWAFVAEKAQNFKMTDQIFQKGIRRLAEPKDLLVKRYQQFQRRLARHYLNTDGDGGNGAEPGSDVNPGLGDGPQQQPLEQQQQQQQRRALSALSTSQSSHAVSRVPHIPQQQQAVFQNNFIDQENHYNNSLLVSSAANPPIAVSNSSISGRSQQHLGVSRQQQSTSSSSSHRSSSVRAGTTVGGGNGAMIFSIFSDADANASESVAFTHPTVDSAARAAPAAEGVLRNGSGMIGSRVGSSVSTEREQFDDAIRGQERPRPQQLGTSITTTIASAAIAIAGGDGAGGDTRLAGDRENGEIQTNQWGSVSIPAPVWRNLGTEEERRKENDGPITKWNEAPLINPTAVPYLLPRPTTTPVFGPTIPIFVDEACRSATGGTQVGEEKRQDDPLEGEAAEVEDQALMGHQRNRGPGLSIRQQLDGKKSAAVKPFSSSSTALRTETGKVAAGAAAAVVVALSDPKRAEEIANHPLARHSSSSSCSSSLTSASSAAAGAADTRGGTGGDVGVATVNSRSSREGRNQRPSHKSSSSSSRSHHSRDVDAENRVPLSSAQPRHQHQLEQRQKQQEPHRTAERPRSVNPRSSRPDTNNSGIADPSAPPVTSLALSSRPSHVSALPPSRVSKPSAATAPIPIFCDENAVELAGNTANLVRGGDDAKVSKGAGGREERGRERGRAEGKHGGAVAAVLDTEHTQNDEEQRELEAFLDQIMPEDGEGDGVTINTKLARMDIDAMFASPTRQLPLCPLPNAERKNLPPEHREKNINNNKKNDDDDKPVVTAVARDAKKAQKFPKECAFSGKDCNGAGAAPIFEIFQDTCSPESSVQPPSSHGTNQSHFNSSCHSNSATTSQVHHQQQQPSHLHRGSATGQRVPNCGDLSVIRHDSEEDISLPWGMATPTFGGMPQTHDAGRGREGLFQIFEDTHVPAARATAAETIPAHHQQQQQEQQQKQEQGKRGLLAMSASTSMRGEREREKGEGASAGKKRRLHSDASILATASLPAASVPASGAEKKALGGRFRDRNHEEEGRIDDNNHVRRRM